MIGGLVDCPKCHNGISDTVVECPHCHIVVAQYLKRRREMASGVVTPGAAPAPVAEEKKGRSPWPVALLLAVFAGYFLLRFNRHKPGPQPTVAVAPAEPKAPETAAPPAPSSDAPDTTEIPSEAENPPQDSSVTEESNDTNASTESFNKGEKRIKKLLHATAPLRIGNPEKVLDDK